MDRSFFLVYKANYKKISNKDFQNYSEQAGFALTYRDSRNTILFLIFTLQIFPPNKKITIPKCNAVFYSETEKKIFSAAVKNNFNMSGGDKSRACVRYVLEIKNFTNCRT